MSNDKSRRLGRGLEALLAAKPQATQSAGTATAPPPGPTRIPLAEIRANPFQPRREFRPEELTDLEASLRASGLLQPVTVRPAPDGKGYELIAGERRFRAATRLGWADIPALVREVDDRALLTLALVENLQRADLNPLDEAEGYQRLIEEFALTQQQVADAVGKDRSTVANMLRLLHLPDSVRKLLRDGQLTLGHARALLALGAERQILEVAREIVANGLSVRDVERRAREASIASGKRPAETRNPKDRAAAPTPEARRLEAELRQRLQTDVRISSADGQRGTIEISFYSPDDFERLLELILGQARR